MKLLLSFPFLFIFPPFSFLSLTHKVTITGYSVPDRENSAKLEEEQQQDSRLAFSRKAALASRTAFPWAGMCNLLGIGSQGVQKLPQSQVEDDATAVASYTSKDPSIQRK